ncbi:MAG: O-antigen ligase family protein [Actinobacteria bacterium]|nr:O-antigen ligase family protein [Actinomycetota bacterium]
MAVFTKHPVSAPPAAPIREKTGHLLLRAWCIFILGSVIAGVGWVNAVGAVGSGLLAAVTGVVSAALWALRRPPVQWRRLPWFALAYVAFAGLSMLWSAWLETSFLTWLLLVVTTGQAMFVASALTWRELVRALASALKWVVALSLLFEIAVATIVGGPLLPGFVRPSGPVDPDATWSRGELFTGGPIQGVFGSADLLAAVALVAIVVFGIRFASDPPHRLTTGAWIALAAFLMIRAGSTTAYLTALAVGVVLVTVMLMRTSQRAGGRTRYYAAYAVIAVGSAAAIGVWRGEIFALLGRAADLAGREHIWATVLEHAAERPVAGWGLATPWLATDPLPGAWIAGDGQPAMQAYNMWVDVFLQLGFVGIVLMIGIYLAVIWRAWFFAIDRPRWDLRADRPYSPVTVLPTLIVTVLLVQGLAESGPLLLWGWMFIVLFGFKIKQAPLVGVGPAEQSLAIESGEFVPSSAQDAPGRPR